MILSLVAALGDDGVIGKDNALLWQLPADLRHFKDLTMGKPVIMGRRTHESIGRPLPGRKNIVVSRRRDYTAAGCVVVNSPEEAIRAASEAAEVMVIGGAELYRQLLPCAHRMYLTLVHGRFEGDTWFPEFDKTQWREVERTDFDSDERNPYRFSFVRLDRVNAASDR